MRALQYAPRSTWQRLAIVFAVALGATLASKGMALLPGYAVDDYGVSFFDQSLTFYLSQGRYTQALLQLIATSLDLRVPSFYWPSTLAAILMLPLVAAFGLTRIGGDTTPVAWQAVGAAVICAHPYFTEYFTFRQALYNASVYITLLFLHLYFAYRVDTSSPLFAKRNLGWVVASSFALMLSLGGHQLVLPMALSFFGMTIVAGRASSSGPPISVKQDLRLLAPAILGTVLYLAAHVTIKIALGDAGDPRGKIVAIQQLGERTLQVWGLIWSMATANEPLFSRACKALMIVPAFAIAVLAFARKPKTTMAYTMVVAVLAAISLVPVSLSGEWWPVPRALSALGFVSGASVVGLLILCGRGRLTDIATPLFFCAALVMTMHSASMLHDQFRLNRWDMNKAQLITYETVKRYGSGALDRLVLVNGGWAYDSRLRTATGDLNISALSVPWAQAPMMMEATGSRISKQPIPPERAARECTQRKAWPADESMYELEGMVVVCL